MKSLKQELVEFKTKIENLTSTKPIVDNKSVYISLKLKTEKVYIPPFKRNNKENAYFARLDKGKNSDVDAEISKPKSKPTVKEHNKSVLLRQKPKSKIRFVVRNTDVPKFVPVCHFCGVSGHIRPNCHKLKSKHSGFQFRLCDNISLTISPYELFHMLLKNLSLLACERNLQDFGLSQKISVIPHIHSTSHGFSPT